MGGDRTLAGRYELLDRVGAGGMGEVWRGKQIALGRVVAIKVIHPHQAGASAEQAEQARRRFSREAELAARVEHRNVIGIIDYGTTEDGTQFLVMPFLKGRSLEDALRGHPSTAEVLAWIDAVLRGLAAIHEAGIVHRDLKPANVFLAEDADGVVPKLLDFGISRGEEPTGPGQALTRMGTALGTPQYMAPEQFESTRDVDARADVYSVGVMLYEALAGRRPVEGDDPFVIYRAILEGQVAPLRAVRPELSPALEELVRRALSRDRDQRFGSARTMRDALERAGQTALAVTEPAPIALARTSLLTPAPAVAPAPTPIAHAAPPAPSAPSRLPIVAAAAALAVLLSLAVGGGGLYFFLHAPEDDAPPAASVTATTEIAPPDRGAPPTSPAAAPAIAPAVAPPAGPIGHRVRYSESIERLAIGWGRLPAADRALDVRVVPEDGGWSIVLGPTVSAAAAARLATTLEGNVIAHAWEPSGGLTPAVVRSTLRLNVHARPELESAITRVLAHDALVVALQGEHPDGVSARAGTEGASTFFVISRTHAGWGAARYLVPEDACLPIPAALARLAGHDADAVREDFAVALTTATVAGRSQRAWLLVGRDPARVRSHVGLFAAREECRPGEPLAYHALDGVIDEAFLGELGALGDTYLAVSWSTTPSPPASGELEWAVFLGDRPDPVWRDRVATAPSLGHDGGAVSSTRDRVVSSHPGAVLGVRRAGRSRELLRWTGSRIAP